MKKVIKYTIAILAFACIANNVSAQVLSSQVKAYVFQQSQNSATSDGYISVKYTMSAKYITNAVYVDQPRLDVEITNISNETIIVDLEKSLFNMNDYSEPLSTGISTTKLTIEPQESYYVSNVNPFPSNASSYANNAYYYRTLRGESFCFAYSDNAGQQISYSESNTPLSLGTLIVYHSVNDDVEYAVNTQYYAFKKIASKLKFAGGASTKQIDSCFPDWRLEQYLTVFLYCLVGN